MSPKALELLYAVFGPQSNTQFPAGVAAEVMEIRKFVETQVAVLKAAQKVENRED